MKKPAILAIDEGTTNAKAVLIDQAGQIVAKASRPLTITHPKAAWSEQDPLEVMQGVNESIAELLQSHSSYEVAGVAVSNQRESVMFWHKETGLPLTSLVTWQCRRSADFCAQLQQGELGHKVQVLSGLPIDPLFPAAKLKWLLENTPGLLSLAEEGVACAGTVDAWLVFNLTAKRSFVTDDSNASRTQLYSLGRAGWDPELLEVFGIPKLCLPEIKPSSAYRGEVIGHAAIADGTPILSQIGDSHAALYGQGGFMPGVIKATYGTGSSLMTPLRSLIKSDDYRLARTVAWHDGQMTHAFEGNITHTGAGVSFMSRMLGIQNIGQFADMAAATTSNDGVYFVPALSGLGAPHWRSDVRGLITGLTDNATPNVLARAAFEAIAYQVADVFYLTSALCGEPLECLLADGGPTQNHWLMQFQADVLNRPVVRSTNAEVSALGAGYLAGKALGWWCDRDDLALLDRGADIIEPSRDKSIAVAGYEGWKDAVARALG